MSAFESCCAALQVGVRRAPVVRSRYLDELQASPEMILLSELGAQSVMRVAGLKVKPVAPLAEAPTALAKIAYASAAPLMEALEDGDQRVVLEWAVAARKRSLAAPHRTLPHLTKMLPRHREEILPVLGERGRWLAQLQGLDLVPSQDVEDVRSTLRDELHALDPKARAAMITRLRDGLSLDDEPLLMEALADKRKEVREAALELLVLLPDSAPSVELQAIAQKVVDVKKSLLGRTLLLEPPDPEALPKWLPRTSAGPELGPRATALLDVARYVLPALWSRTCSMSPSEFVDRLARTDYARAFIEGLGQAVVRFGDREWADALVIHDSRQGSINNSPIMQVTSEPVLERVVLKSLEQQGQPVQVTINALASLGRQLSPTLSKRVVEAYLQAPSKPYSSRDLAFCLDVSVLPTVQSALVQGEATDPLLEHWHRILDLRARLLKSLS